MEGHPFIIIYSNSAIDPYTVRSYSLEHKQYHNIVIGKEKYIYILYIRPDDHAQFTNKCLSPLFSFFFSVEISLFPSIVCTRYVCMVITYCRVWINRLRLPILRVVS